MAVLDNRCSVVQTMHERITSAQWWMLLKLSDGNNVSVLHKFVEQHPEGGSKMMKQILSTLNGDEIYRLLCAQNSSKQTVVHLLAKNAKGFPEVFQLITGSLNELQWFNLLKIIDGNGATAVHQVASAGLSSEIKVMLNHLTARHQLDVLDVIDADSKEAEDCAIEHHHDDLKTELRLCKKSARQEIFEGLDCFYWLKNYTKSYLIKG